MVTRKKMQELAKEIMVDAYRCPIETMDEAIEELIGVVADEEELDDYEVSALRDLVQSSL